MMSFFKGMSLKNRIILLSVTLIISISVIFSVIYVQYISNQMKKSAYNSTKVLSYQVSIYFDEQIRTVISSAYTLISSSGYNDTLLNFLMSDDVYAYPTTLTQVNDYISNIKMDNQFISSIYIYTPKGNFYDLSSLPKTNFDFLYSNLYSEYSTFGSPPFFEGHSGPNELYQEKRTVIPIVIRTPIPGYSGDVFLIVNINSDLLDRYLASSATDQEDIVVINSGLQLIASNESGNDENYIKMLSIKNGQIHWKTNNYLISYNQSQSNGWYVVTLLNSNQVRATIRYSAFFAVLLIFASGFIACICSIFLSNRIIRPLADLQKYMVRFTKGDYEIRYEYNYKNEVGNLADCFNYMVEQIGTLVSKLSSTIDQLRTEKENVKQEQSLKRAAELNALQAQINPHFLYNTLNSIVWLATEKDAKEISLLASELSKFYEYRIHRGKNVIPIRDEIGQVKSYLTIQKIRYGNNLEHHFYIDKTLMEKSIIKMVIQPLVENAIFHGIQCKEGAKDIFIRIYKEDKEREDIVIVVEDNGIGIPPEKLEEMNERLDFCSDVPLEGYGIYNVNERIKLYYGNEYGLHFESEYKQWTKAYIRIPQKENLPEHLA
jgi:two-component system sensor histidine kinase YesM